MTTADDWLSVREGAAYLGVSRTTFNTWRGQRLFPWARVGRVVRVRRGALDKFMAGHERARR